MLLTISFGRSDSRNAKPLSSREWTRLAIWLKNHGSDPAGLLKGDLEILLDGWLDHTVSVARLQALLGRGAALGLALERWQRAGLWVLTRSDPDYPERLRRRLGSEAPTVLFGCGNKSLLNRGGIAVVGSRTASEEDLIFTVELGKDAALQGYSIVSGGARGVDQSAMFGALKYAGTAVGVLADSLLKSATSAKYRRGIMSGDLVLISPYNPEAGFNVGNAMSRNRHIYCLADAAIVVSSTPHKGGTWYGALEDLKANWVPLWVKDNTNATSGNSELVQKGARRLPDNLTSFAILSTPGTSSADESRHGLPLVEPKPEHLKTSEPTMEDAETSQSVGAIPEAQSQMPPASECPADISRDQIKEEFYSLFLNRMLDITADSPMKSEDVATRLELPKSQVNAWLQRGLQDGKITKSTRPVRYKSAAAKRKRATLFGDDGEIDISRDQIKEEFYSLFLNRMLDITADSPMKSEDVATRLELPKSQVNAWLKQGLQDGKITKSTRPVRYKSAATKRKQTTLFGDDGDVVVADPNKF